MVHTSIPWIRHRWPYQLAIPVSTNPDEWIAAEVLRDEFTHTQSLLPAVDAATDVENPKEASIELYSKFLGFITANVYADGQSIQARTSLLLNALTHFTSSYTSTKDIHNLTATFGTETRKTILSAYFEAIATLQAQGVAEIPSGPEPALLSAAAKGKASIFALFGGQGTNEVYFDELQALYDIYKPFVAPYLSSTIQVLKSLAEEEQDTTYYTYGFDVISWLDDPSLRPSVPYLASVPISFPLIALTQLVQYLVVCKVVRLTPGELRARMSGATGHSQGLVSAVVLAASGTFESFIENSCKALKWMFYSGLRGQQAFPVVSVEPDLVQDSVNGGEGVPSPMLSITGLNLHEVESHITTTNAHLPSNSHLHVSLHNGPRAFVVTGPARALHGLVNSLRKVRAPSGLDQSKIPFSQRKPVFSVRFLVVGVPYHSEYLNGTTDQLLEDLEEELWQPRDLKIPVFNTEDGNYFLFSPPICD